jgi:mannose-6-phosphate isomerase-like protein (cupin superfamily)
VSGFTLKNLKSDVEDSAVKFGYSPALESHFAREALETEQLGISYQRLAPDVRAPFGHRHREQEEIYVVVGGSGRAKLADEVVELRPFDALRVAPEVTRQFEAGPDGLELIAVGAPATGLQDAKQEMGWWAETD